MESLIADFVQFSCTIAKFLYLERRLDTMSTLNLLKDPKSEVVRQLVKQLVHSTSGDNKLSSFHLW